MSDYHVLGNQTVNSTTATTLTLERGASARFKVYDFTSGFGLASPSDNLLLVTCQRFDTDDGTAGTSPTPNALDPADGVSLTTAQYNHSIEPSSYVADGEVVGPFGQHMRATYRWVAAPGKEIVVANVAAEGVGFFADHASATPEHHVDVFFSE